MSHATPESKRLRAVSDTDENDFGLDKQQQQPLRPPPSASRNPHLPATAPAASSSYPSPFSSPTSPPSRPPVSLRHLPQRPASSMPSLPPPVLAPALEPTSLLSECRRLISLSLPTVVVQLSATIPPAVTASYVGRHLGTECLDGFSLGIIATNVVGLAVLQGLLSASDTLGPQAYGAGNYPEVGRVAVRSVLVGWAVSLPLNGAASLIVASALVALGEDPSVSVLASAFFLAYCVPSTPFFVVFQSAWKFLQAQDVMSPLVITTTFCCVVVLPASLAALVPLFGFVGSALAMLTFQICQATSLLLYLYWTVPHDPETWPGLPEAWKGVRSDVVALRTYLSLGLGGVLASTEWWYWEIMCGLVGTFGIVPLSVHTVPNQVVAVSYMIPLGGGIALSARLGNLISSDADMAKRLVCWFYGVGLALMAAMAFCIWYFRSFIVSLFTVDPEVIEGCERIWLYVALFHFNLSIYAFNMGTMNGLGMQWQLGRVTLAFSWLLGLPLAYYVSVLRGGGLDGLWKWVINTPYVGMNVVLCMSFVMADWHEIGEKVREREGMVDDLLSDGGDVSLIRGDYGSVDETKTDGQHSLL